jgi:hemolysin activation/secretion protein
MNERHTHWLDRPHFGNELMRLTPIILLCAGLMVVCTSRAEQGPVAPAAADAKAGDVRATDVAPAPAKKTSFNIMEYRIEGNKVLSATRIEEVVYRYLGEDKTIADVESARSALEQAYRDAGYLTVLVDIPEQTVSSGIVRLKVAEGSVEKVRVVGSRYYDLGRILAKVAELAQDSIPYFPGVQTQMADANRAADLRVTPVLRPGMTPGKVEVDLKVEDKLPLHGSLDLSNYAGPNTDPLRLTGMVRYDNLWQREHSLSLQYQTAPQDTNQVRVLSGTYLMPLNDGNQLAMYAVVSHSNVAAVGDMTLLGQGNIYGARWVIPLRTKPGLFHSATLGVDYKDFANDTLLAGSNTGHTPISYIPFSAGYNLSLPDNENMTTANVTLNFKLRGVGDHTTDCSGQTVSQFECMRYGAKPDYFYARGGVDRTQSLFWGTTLYVKLDGQMTGGPLISNEQFVAGGADSVRGYREAEQAGDDGEHGTLELRGPQWASGRVNDLRVLTFYDFAHLRVQSPLPGQISKTDLASVGVGMRFQAWTDLTVRLDAGWPSKGTTYTQAGKPRVGFKATLAF